jgi:beta-lactam-binding protein with PASTA domain
VYVPSQEPLGTVVAQAQTPGTERRAGDTVQLNASRGPESAVQASVPNVVGQTLDDARSALEQAQLEVLVIQVGEGESDQVARQTPQAGASIPAGALVVLYAGAS